MKTFRFNDLSADIKAMIISHVMRPTDMKNLCLSSKELHEITVRTLYHDVSLDIGSTNDGRFVAFLNPRNIGLQHVRNLDLYLAEGCDKWNQLQQANLTIRMILEFLPENVLEKFCWHPWSRFSAENLQLLYKRQRRLRRLEAIALDRNIVPELEKQIAEMEPFLKNVQKLSLYPDTTDVLSLSNLLVKNTPNVQRMTIYACFDETGPQTRELHDTPTEPGLISRTLFGHMQPFEKCTPLALTDFTIHKINLRYATSMYCKIINFQTVRKLNLFGCPGVDALLAELSKSKFLPERLKNFEFKHEDNDENDALNALDGFLCLVSGLQYVTIDLWNVKSLPSASGITRHAKTLMGLNLHAGHRDDDGNDEELVMDLQAYQRICRECTLLEQLSVAFPKIRLVRAPTDTWLAFMDALDTLPKLVTLNSTTWPSPAPMASLLPRSIYESLLAELATSFFVQASEKGARLRVVAFGTSDRVYEREDSKSIIIFVRGAQSAGPLVPEKPIAIQVGWNLRRYIEPNSDILEFAMSRNPRPPTREAPSSEDSD